MLCICSQHPGSAFYVTFEQCVETLRIIKKGDTVSQMKMNGNFTLGGVLNHMTQNTDIFKKLKEMVA